MKEDNFPLWDNIPDDPPVRIYFSPNIYKHILSGYNISGTAIKQALTYLGVKVSSDPKLRDEYTRTKYKSGRIIIKKWMDTHNANSQDQFIKPEKNR